MITKIPAKVPITDPYIGLQANWQQIITGAVLIIAVLIDIMKEKKAAAK